MLNHRISFVILATALFLSGHAATLSGTVQDSANGSPLQGAIVSLRSGVQTLKIDTTDISGLFSLTTVDSGTYTIRTVKATYTTQNSTIHIDTTSQQSTVINLSITQYSTITGVITDSITGNPVTRALISLRVPLPATGAVGFADTTAADGVYVLNNVPNGPYRIRVTTVGYIRTFFDVTTHGTAAHTADIAIAPIEQSSITGVITDSITGSTLFGIIVSLDSNNTIVKIDTTGSDGVYRFDSVSSGSYTIRSTTIRSTTIGYAPKTIPISTSGSATQTVNILLAKAYYGSIAGTITDSITHYVLSAVTIKLLNGNTTVKTVQPIDDGTYRIDNIITGSTYSLRLTSDGYVTKTASITVSDTINYQADFAIAPIPFCTIHGVAVDSISQAVLDSTTVTLRNGTTTLKTSITGTNGAYQFDSVMSGSYTVRARRKGYILKNYSVTVTTADTQRLALQLSPLPRGRITGMVRRDSLMGAPLAQVKMYLRQSNITLDSTVTDSTGIYLFTNVLSGDNFSVQGVKAGYDTKPVPHNNQTAGTDTVNLFLLKITEKDLYIRVLKQADSTALLRADVTFISNATAMPAVTDSTGTCLLSGVMFNSYIISAVCSGFTPYSKMQTIGNTTGDTITIFLAADSNSNKILCGTVTDSITGMPLAHVRVLFQFRIGQLTMASVIDSTDSNGTYLITGIPANSPSGKLTLSCSTYAALIVALVQLPTDTVVLNIALRSASSGTNHAAHKPAIRQLFGMMNGRLHVPYNTGGTLSIFTMNGKRVWRHTLDKQTSVIDLPDNIAKTTTLLVARITQYNKLLYSTSILP